MSKPKKKKRGRGNHRRDFNGRLELVRIAAAEMKFSPEAAASDQQELHQLAHRTGLNRAQVKQALIHLDLWQADDEHKKEPRRASVFGYRS